MLITNTTIVTMTGEILENSDLLIEDNKIAFIGKYQGNKAKEEIINGEGKICLPGLINCHTHLGMSLFRNYSDGMPLESWLNDKIWPLEAKLNPSDIYKGSLLSMAEMVSSGTTCFVDMYDYMDEVASAAEEIGMRGIISQGVTEAGDIDKKIEITEGLLKNYEDRSFVTAWSSPHAVYTCGPSTIKKLSDLAKKYKKGVHVHCSETDTERENCLKEYGRTPVEQLEAYGALDGPSILAHCVTVDSSDIDIIKEKGASVCHNPSSNLKLASGIAPVNEMLEKRINVCLGTDGASSNNMLDLFIEMRTASLLAKGLSKDAQALSAKEALVLATVNGAKAIGRDDLGSLEVGKTADIILVDRKGPNHYPRNDVYSELVYSTTGNDVCTTIIDGQLVYKDYRFVNIDINESEEEVEEAFIELLKR